MIKLDTKNHSQIIILVLAGFLILSISQKIKAETFNVGLNQAWLHTRFEYQWLDKYYDHNEAKRILDLTKQAGSKTLRMWLFEGVNSNSLVWNNGVVEKIHPEFLKNFESFLIEAKSRDIQIYITFFSPGALKENKDQGIKNRWWNLLNNKYGALDAMKNALSPLLTLIYSDDYRNTIFGIDLANEIDAALVAHAFENEWYSANNFICELRNTIRSATPKGKLSIPVTASLGWGYIPFVSRGAENIILDPNPHADCVDFWDIHLYNNGGDIKNCEAIKKVIKTHNKKIYLGEFGQYSKAYDDKLQLQTTENFILNAKKCGFSGALAWRLSDVKAGNEPNYEARYSLESFGKMRPAYEYIKKFNEDEIIAYKTKNKNERMIASEKKKSAK